MKSLLLSFLFVFSLGFCDDIGFEWVDETMAYEIEDCKEQAKLGDANCQFLYGAYLHHKEFRDYNDYHKEKRDFTHAIKWIKMSASQGDVRAKYYLALFYNIGRAVPKNQNKCLTYLKESASQLFIPAIRSLGYYYRNVDKKTLKSLMYFFVCDELSPFDSYTIKIIEFLENSLQQEEVDEARLAAKEWLDLTSREFPIINVSLKLELSTENSSS